MFRSCSLHPAARWRRAISGVAGVALLGTPAEAQPRRAPARPAVLAAVSAPIDSTILRALQWREVGPFRGGRSVAVAGTQARPNEYWMGTTGGGVLKTTDGGESWTEITRNSGLPPAGLVGRIGVAVSRANSTRVYALVEHDSGGLFRSEDAGRTWSPLGEGLKGVVPVRLLFPLAPESGAEAFLGTGQGVFRTADGGMRWESAGLKDETVLCIGTFPAPERPPQKGRRR